MSALEAGANSQLMFGLHTPEASDLHVCALSPVLPQKTVSGLSASNLRLCMHQPRAAGQ